MKQVPQQKHPQRRVKNLGGVVECFCYPQGEKQEIKARIHLRMLALKCIYKL